MKRLWIACALLAAGPLAQAEVGVSVTVGDPHFYGRIEIGNYPRPELVYPQPIVVVQQPQRYSPVYLRVPPGHAKNWKKHCSRYSACNRPVYFVQDSWYNDVYAPRYREAHPGHGHHDNGHGQHGKGHGKGKGKHD
ncbi:hypothetical protein [Chitinolyticbacter albus]|uniref:hypothetical protein n=1 Tax=Chitinolyticbacter albus TaxID=2961951 RepID=UPI00210DD23F|nr:hypothetical protein [Chitinolyticbacter albus]